MRVDLPEAWTSEIGEELEKPYFRALADFIDAERTVAAVYPPEADVFNAMKLAPFDMVKVVILGQDPYHNENQAHGLCFSVRSGVQPPPSLINIFKELRSDLGIAFPTTGCLSPWAAQGILLLNSVLTVRAHEPNSHKGKGWETFTDAAIRALSLRDETVVFVLWGAFAQKKASLIDTDRHDIIAAAHPSPLSARNGFFGSRPFSRINELLRARGRQPIDWQL